MDIVGILWKLMASSFKYPLLCYANLIGFIEGRAQKSSQMFSGASVTKFIFHKLGIEGDDPE